MLALDIRSTRVDFTILPFDGEIALVIAARIRGSLGRIFEEGFRLFEGSERALTTKVGGALSTVNHDRRNLAHVLLSRIRWPAPLQTLTLPGNSNLFPDFLTRG